MKKLVTFSFCSLIFSISIAQKAMLRTDLQQMNLKGKVKSIREVAYIATNKNGLITKADTNAKPELFGFDPAGNKVSDILYNSDGSFEVSNAFVYSKPGLLKERKYFNVNQKQWSEKEISEYNDNDYLISTTIYDSLGKITNRKTYRYFFDERKNKYTRQTDSLYYSGFDGKNLRATSSNDYEQITFDSAKNIIIKKQKINNRYSQVSYEYNNKKQVIAELYHDNSRQNGKEAYDQIYYISSIKYDANGNEIKSVTEGTSSRNISYTYDANKNWVKKVIENISPGTGESSYVIVERKITYF